MAKHQEAALAKKEEAQENLKAAALARSNELRRRQDPGRSAFSIGEFCQRNGISLSFYFLLQKQGLGPRTMRVGHRRIITLEAEADWQHEREAG
jgi:hypothetical protein